MPSHDLPIDIPYAKLAEWLISRQKLSKDWHKKLQAIRAKAAELAKDLPPDLALPEGESVEYAAVKQIRDTLAETAEKTFFGNLTGTAGLWDKVLRAYEKDNIYLGEAGQLLVRNVDFEIPYLKQQAAKEQQQLADFERKHNEHLHSAVQAARQYQQECETMGIKGVSIKQELSSLTKGLPSTFHQAAEQLQCTAVGEACTHYTAFLSATLGSSNGSHSAAELLPAIHRVREAHLEAETPAPDQDASSMSAQTHEVRVGDSREDVTDTAISAAGTEQQEASAGQEPHTSEADGGDISWDIDISAAEGVAQGEEGQADIDWDADPVADGDAPAQNIDWDIGVDGNAAQEAPELAQTGGIVGEMVSDGDFRSSLVNEVHELMAFLQTRLSEAGSMQMLGGSHALLESISSASLKHWLQELRSAADRMTSERTQQLLLFQTSERYISRVAAALQHKAGQESKFRRQAQQVETRRQNIRSTLAAGSSRLAFLLDKTRAVKQLAEETLSTQLDRTVLIVGEINNLLD